MSVQTEIDRLSSAKTSLKTAIEAKGVDVADNAHIDNYADYVNQIPIGISEIDVNTDTSITGLLKGADGKVAQAVAGTDYAAPAELTLTRGPIVFSESGTFDATLYGLKIGSIVTVVCIGGGAGGSKGGTADGNSGGAGGAAGLGGKCSNGGGGGSGGSGIGAGGGGGGGANANNASSVRSPASGGSGGGAGQMQISTFALQETTIPVTVGLGGASATAGEASSFGSYLTASGGAVNGGGVGGAGAKVQRSSGSNYNLFGGGGGGGAGGWSIVMIVPVAGGIGGVGGDANGDESSEGYGSGGGSVMGINGVSGIYSDNGGDGNGTGNGMVLIWY